MSVRLQRRRAALFGLVVLAAGLLGEQCLFNPLPFNRGLRVGANPDVCTVLQSPSPLALEFASGRLWVADAQPPTLVPFDVDTVPPQLPAAPAPVPLPADSDGNGTNDSAEGGPPLIDDIISGGFLFLVPTANKEAVLTFSPSAGAFASVGVTVPATFDGVDNPFLPVPGGGRIQTGISTQTCIIPLPGAVDSAGGAPPVAECPGGYYSRLTSGVVVDTVTQQALVGFANPSLAVGSYLPAAVAVYDFDPAGVVMPLAQPPANTDITTIFTNPLGFNVSDVVLHTTIDESGAPRRFALVVTSGNLGLAGGGVTVTTPSFIDVIDLETLQRVASFDLGVVGVSFAGIQIDPTGSVAVVGGLLGRNIYAIDLTILSRVAVPDAAGLPVPFTRPNGVIFDAANPLVVPSLGLGLTCPGAIRGLGFNQAGTRLFATDFCEGSFSVTDFSPTAPFVAGSFGVPVPQVFTGPRTGTDDRPRGPTRLAVRPEPLANYDGPDVFVLVAEPQGMVCGLFVEKTRPPVDPASP